MRYLTLLAFLCSISLIQAQDAKTDALLQSLVDKYSESASAQMSFSLEITPAESDSETFAGTFARKGSSFYLNSPMQSVISDGKDAWIYIPDNEEVQIVDADEEGSLFSPQTLLEKFYNDSYKYRTLPAASDGSQIIEFVPVNAEDEEIYKMKMTVQPTALLIQELKAFDRSGDTYTMTLSDQEFDLELADELFVFDAKNYPDAYIEDLRID